MAISTAAELKTAIGNWLERPGGTEVTNRGDEWIALGEAELNRELLGLRTTTVTDLSLTGTVSSRDIDISGLAFLAAVSLILTTDTVERVLRPFTAGTRRHYTSNGYPNAWAINGDNIELDKPCDQAHTFEFRYHKALDIITDSTNWLLTNYPDAYLFKSLKHAAIYFKDPQTAVGYDALASGIVDKIMAAELKNQRSTLVVDDALLPRRSPLTLGEFTSGVTF
jgi:hypothetical protein